MSQLTAERLGFIIVIHITIVIIFSVKCGKIHPFNKYETVARKVVDQTFVKWIETSEDSILRKIEEQANKNVQDAK